MTALLACPWCSGYVAVLDGARAVCPGCGHHVGSDRGECGCRRCLALRSGACAVCEGPLDRETVARDRDTCWYCRVEGEAT